jgi:hypothetical protein
MTTSSLVTIGAISVTAIAVVGSVPPLLDAVFADAPAPADLAGRFEQYAEGHEKMAAENRARFDGRSFFFAPKPPPDWSPPRREVTPPPPRPRTEPRDPTPPPPPPPPPPVRYNGPEVIGMDGQSVYFDKDGIRIGVGETNEDLGVTVLSVEGAPWTVKISYRDTEFDLPLFKEWGESSKFFTGTTKIEGAAAAPLIRPTSSSSSVGGRNRATPTRGGSRNNDR